MRKMGFQMINTSKIHELITYSANALLSTLVNPGTGKVLCLDDEKLHQEYVKHIFKKNCGDWGRNQDGYYNCRLLGYRESRTRV